MAEAKTTPREGAEAFLAAVEPAARREEARVLDALFRRASGHEPVLWGPSILGYGRYAYRYDSGRTGESLATGFSPRKAEISIYVMPGYADHAAILAQLGPHRRGASCLYVRRLSAIDLGVLEELGRAGLANLARTWAVTP
jgi:hypothetical protein